MLTSKDYQPINKEQKFLHSPPLHKTPTDPVTDIPVPRKVSYTLPNLIQPLKTTFCKTLKFYCGEIAGSREETVYPVKFLTYFLHTIPDLS